MHRGIVRHFTVETMTGVRCDGKYRRVSRPILNENGMPWSLDPRMVVFKVLQLHETRNMPSSKPTSYDRTTLKKKKLRLGQVDDLLHSRTSGVVDVVEQPEISRGGISAEPLLT